MPPKNLTLQERYYREGESGKGIKAKTTIREATTTHAQSDANKSLENTQGRNIARKKPRKGKSRMKSLETTWASSRHIKSFNWLRNELENKKGKGSFNTIA